MAGRVVKIDTFEFVSMRGLPVLPQTQLEMVSRPGVEGHSFWDLGARGVPFPVETMVDTLTLDEAFEQYASYKELIADDPVEMTWEDIDLVTHQVRVKVLDVQPLQIRSIMAASGGTQTDPKAKCRVRWTLVCVPLVASDPDPAPAP